MMSEWVTFFLSMLCCQCLENRGAMSDSSGRNSISVYKMLSDHSVFLESGNTGQRVLPFSDTEVQLRNHAQLTSQEELDITDSGETTVGPSIYIEQACGEPQGQQLVVDFSPQITDGDIELREPIYDLDSSSVEVSSESEPGLVQGRGDHMNRAKYRAERISNESETEVIIKTHYPEYESCSTDGHDVLSLQSEVTVENQVPRGQPRSSPELNINNQNTTAMAVINQKQYKDPSFRKEIQINSGDTVWEFQSCYSTSMGQFGSDALWKTFKPDTSVQIDSEVELKTHSYSFVNSSVEDMVIIQKEGEQKPLTKAPMSAPKNTWIPNKENNFPAVHGTKNHGEIKILSPIKWMTYEQRSE